MPQVQVPHGAEDMTCPLHKQAMSEVCHKCPLWVKVRGKDPQSENEIDRWDCSLAWMPLLLIENSQMQRQTSVEINEFKNEMVKMNQAPHIIGTLDVNGLRLLNGK